MPKVSTLTIVLAASLALPANASASAAAPEQPEAGVTAETAPALPTWALPLLVGGVTAAAAGASYTTAAAVVWYTWNPTSPDIGIAVRGAQLASAAVFVVGIASTGLLLLLARDWKAALLGTLGSVVTSWAVAGVLSSTGSLVGTVVGGMVGVDVAGRNPPIGNDPTERTAWVFGHALAGGFIGMFTGIVAGIAAGLLVGPPLATAAVAFVTEDVE